MAATMGAAGDLFRLVRKGIDVRAVQAHTRKPFRFLLCGDPAYVADLRSLLLAGHEGGTIPMDAAATLETISPQFTTELQSGEARCILYLGRRGDLNSQALTTLKAARLPIFALTIDESAQPSGPASPPVPGSWAEYTVAAVSRDALKGRLFPHLIEVCKGVEIAVGRNLPALRETVAAKLTRDAANNALKVALASALVDHIPVIGIVLGALASAGDTVAITGLQMMLARELSGFIPVAGIGIKGAIAYAGTIVVGEGVTFYYEHGRHMSKGQAASIYERTKNDAMTFARDLIEKFKKS
ncbi:MAG: hypothetical protein ABR584_06790 [Candidatus Baltobacteraceae bacterium]